MLLSLPATNISLVSATQGTLIGTIIDWATAKRPDRSAYLIPLGIIYVVPVILSIVLFFIPESPRWLILMGRNEEGKKSLKWLRPKGSDIDGEAVEIRAAIDAELEMGRGVGVLDMFKNVVDLRRTTIAVCGVTLQAASGSMFIIGEFSESAGKRDGKERGETGRLRTASQGETREGQC